MSLIHRRKSIIFNTPETTAPKLQIQQLLQSHKANLQIHNRSSSKPRALQKQKLSLGQAVKLEELHQRMSGRRGFSLNALLRGFDCPAGVGDGEGEGEGEMGVDCEKMGLFRTGVYYRSGERAKGAGVRKCSQEELKDYFNCEDSINMGKKAVLASMDKKLRTTNFTSTKTASLKQK